MKFIEKNIYSDTGNVQIPFEDSDENAVVLFDTCETEKDRKVITDAIEDIYKAHPGIAIVVDPLMYYIREQAETDINNIITDPYNDIVDSMIKSANYVYYIKNSTDTTNFDVILNRILDNINHSKIVSVDVLFDPSIYKKYDLSAKISDLIVPTYDENSDILVDLLNINTYNIKEDEEN